MTALPKLCLVPRADGEARLAVNGKGVSHSREEANDRGGAISHLLGVGSEDGVGFFQN